MVLKKKSGGEKNNPTELALAGLKTSTCIWRRGDGV